MKKKIWSCAVVFVMALSMVACGNSDGLAQSDAGESARTASEAQGASSEDAAEDMAEITMMYYSMGTVPKDIAVVEDAINEITEVEINTHVTMEVLEPGSYEQQINLKMSSQEPFDLMMTVPMGSASFSSMAAQNQFMDITQLLEEYGQPTLDTIGELIKGTTIDGKIYGVTPRRSLVTSVYIVMRTDVLEDLGLLEKAQNMTSLEEYEEILAAVKASEKWNYLAGIVASDVEGTCMAVGGANLGENRFEDDTCYDPLGDTTKLISASIDGSSSVVMNNYATEHYRKMYDVMHNWYEKGYVYGYITTQTDKAEEMIKSNVGFSYFVQSEIGVETAKSTACGMPMTCVKMITLPISTGSCTKFVWTVPVTSKEPEAAIKFMNMMYTNQRIANLLAWGIEGTHYQVKDGVAYFVDGEDESNARYHTCDFLYGNQFLVYPWDGQSADFRSIAEAEMDDAQISPYLGFSCDTTGISNETAAVVNVIAEYHPGIDSGVAPEENYDAFLEKLEKSGADKIIAEYQMQLDEWLKDNSGK